MTVVAGLIANLSHIDLQCTYRLPPQFKHPVFLKGLCEGHLLFR